MCVRACAWLTPAQFSVAQQARVVTVCAFGHSAAPLLHPLSADELYRMTTCHPQVRAAAPRRLADWRQPNGACCGAGRRRDRGAAARPARLAARQGAHGEAGMESARTRTRT